MRRVIPLPDLYKIPQRSIRIRRRKPIFVDGNQQRRQRGGRFLPLAGDGQGWIHMNDFPHPMPDAEIILYLGADAPGAISSVLNRSSHKITLPPYCHETKHML